MQCNNLQWAHTMKFTLTQAAVKTGKDRSTLYRAIKKGKLSGELQADKSYLIDSSELFRVYEEKSSVDAVQYCAPLPVQQPARDELIESLNAQIELLKAQVERDREQIAKEQEHAIHWRQQAVMLLEHHAPVQDFNPTRKEDSLLWRKLFGRGR